ncbi:hypothetical protein [Micromonospora sp. NPDC051296]
MKRLLIAAKPRMMTVSRLLAKLDARDRTALAVIAHRAGLSDPDGV